MNPSASLSFFLSKQTCTGMVSFICLQRCNRSPQKKQQGWGFANSDHCLHSPQIPFRSQRTHVPCFIGNKVSTYDLCLLSSRGRNHSDYSMPFLFIVPILSDVSKEMIAQCQFRSWHFCWFLTSDFPFIFISNMEFVCLFFTIYSRSFPLLSGLNYL